MLSKKSVVCSPGGAASHFLSYLIDTDSKYISALDNNEYLVHNTVIHSAYYDPTINKWIRIARDHNPHVLQCHSNKLVDLVESLNHKCDVYNITTDEQTHRFTAACATIKNIIDRRTVDVYIRAPLALESYIEYSRQFLKSVSIGYPYAPIAVKYFIECYDGIFNKEHYKEYVKIKVLERLEECKTHIKYEMNYQVPHSLEDITTTLTYKELFFDQVKTGTLFDNYSTEIKDYHERNINLIERVFNYFDIPLDFYPFVDYNIVN